MCRQGKSRATAPRRRPNPRRHPFDPAMTQVVIKLGPDPGQIPIDAVNKSRVAGGHPARAWIVRCTAWRLCKALRVGDRQARGPCAQRQSNCQPLPPARRKRYPNSVRQRQSEQRHMKFRTMMVGLAKLATTTASLTARADAELDRLIANPANWAAQAGDYANHRYSELKQVHAGNAKNLQVAWTVSTGVLRGHEGSPLVFGDTMYIHSPFPNKVIALNLKDQTFKWKYEPKQDNNVVPVMRCDTVSRGLAYGDGKILLQQADTTLEALDAQTGKVVWSVKNGDPKIGETNTNAPHVFKDKVITGISGGEFGVRGRLIAYDLKTGKTVWTAFSTGPDEDMLFDPATTMTWTDGKMAPVGKDSSLKTWKGDQWKLGGGTTWGWYSYDPKLNLVYYGSGNPGTWNPSQRPGDNKWSMTLFARDLDPGKARWVYQMTPHDEWDYDGVNELVLADLNIKGKKVPSVVHMDRNGYAYTLQRETGELLVAEKFDPTINWASKIDMKSGRPVVNAKYSPATTGPDVNVKGICPSALGTKDQQPMSYDRKSGIFLVPTNHVCMDYEPFQVE